MLQLCLGILSLNYPKNQTATKNWKKNQQKTLLSFWSNFFFLNGQVHLLGLRLCYRCLTGVDIANIKIKTWVIINMIFWHFKMLNSFYIIISSFDTFIWKIRYFLVQQDCLKFVCISNKFSLPKPLFGLDVFLF